MISLQDVVLSGIFIAVIVYFVFWISLTTSYDRGFRRGKSDAEDQLKPILREKEAELREAIKALVVEQAKAQTLPVTSPLEEMKRMNWIKQDKKAEIWIALLMWYEEIYNKVSQFKNCDEYIFRGELFFVSYVFSRNFCLLSKLSKFDDDFLKIWENEWCTEWDATDLPYLISDYIKSNFFRRTSFYRNCARTGQTKDVVTALCEKISYSGDTPIDEIVSCSRQLGAFFMRTGVSYVPIDIHYMDLFFEKLYEDGWHEWNDYRLNLLRDGKGNEILPFRDWKSGID